MAQLTDPLRFVIVNSVRVSMQICPVQYKVQEALYKQLPPDMVTVIKNNPEYYPETELTVTYIESNKQRRVGIQVRGAIGPFELSGSELLIKLGLYDELQKEILDWISAGQLRSEIQSTLRRILDTYVHVGVLLRDFPEFEGILAPHVDLSEVTADPAYDLRRTLVPMLKSHGWRETE